jgi:hypothetical protein
LFLSTLCVLCGCLVSATARRPDIGDEVIGSSGRRVFPGCTARVILCGLAPKNPVAMTDKDNDDTRRSSAR